MATGEVQDMLPAYVQSLIPTTYDITTVASRKGTLRSALESGGVDIVSDFEAGSFSHGTAIKGHADVDWMVRVAQAQKPGLPSSTLTRFKNGISRSSASIVSVAVSSPTVQVKFQSEPHFEVVPAFYWDQVKQQNVYEIPGRRDEWVHSAPAAHNALVNQQNDRLNKKLKPLIRLAKAWKYHVDAPVSSFYLEMRTTAYAQGESVIIYKIDLPHVFRSIINASVADMNDPSQIAGRIPACSSDEKRRQTKSLLETAVSELEAAEACRSAGKPGDYWRHMVSVFGYDFPFPS